jgi:hypothetical protein
MPDEWSPALTAGKLLKAYAEALQKEQTVKGSITICPCCQTASDHYEEEDEDEEADEAEQDEEEEKSPA